MTTMSTGFVNTAFDDENCEDLDDDDSEFGDSKSQPLHTTGISLKDNSSERYLKKNIGMFVYCYNFVYH